ncbi:hypothetical protein ABT124_32115 [Streptomyces sp. NPDC001982]|uniref:hypothetical protein n=1 Tax=Streptomyces sp. NPDC001982 TaxID=3154405 RepID=UPI0033288AD1
MELDEEIPEQPGVRMARLRTELASAVASSTVSAAAVAGQIVGLLATAQDALRAREEAGAPQDRPRYRSCT